jgi:hypothetical protein
MSKERSPKKEVKKKANSTLKEKRSAKKAKNESGPGVGLGKS